MTPVARFWFSLLHVGSLLTEWALTRLHALMDREDLRPLAPDARANMLVLVAKRRELMEDSHAIATQLLVVERAIARTRLLGRA